MLLEARTRRLGGVRSQRRVLRRVADARPGQRARPVPRRGGRARRGSAARTSTRSRRRCALRHRLRIRAHRRAVGRRRAAPGRVACARTSPQPRRARPRRGVPRPRRGARRGRLADLPRRRLGPQRRRARRSRPGWRGGCARRACGSACASTRTPRSRACTATGRRCSLQLRAGRDRCGRAASRSATNAFPAPLRRLRPYTVPVYDYVLMTEPLIAAQLASIGWRNRQGIGDVANQFHYYRLTRRQPDPVGRLRRRLLLAQRPARRARPAAGDVRAARATSSSRRSRSSTGCGSPTAGAAPSTRRRGSSPSRARARRPGRLQPRLHRARCRRRRGSARR